ERSRAEILVADARRAVEEQAPLDRARQLTGELQQVLGGLSAAGAGAGAGAGGGQGPAPGAGAAADDDVIDAEFDRS
ncbi:molecular chaperone DnaK, partial [Pseudonocardia aurantiaca]